MTIHFNAYDQCFVDAIRAGGQDANGQPAENAVSDGNGNPCRSCLCEIPMGSKMLVLAARPFPTLQPYAETGPIFLCKAKCRPWAGKAVPPILKTSPDYLLKAYGADNRILYGTGRIVLAEKLREYSTTLLSDRRVAYVDVRSARNNCFQTRITSAA